ncbi:MAG: hypothetical protein Q8878_07805 [Bacillota bacterium]|nr:hypothetical protein [Bacillota bacterium]
MLYAKKYDKTTLAALTHEKEKHLFDGLHGKVIKVGLACGEIHTGILVSVLRDGIKLYLLFPSGKKQHPFGRCTYEYIFFSGIASVETNSFN